MSDEQPRSRRNSIEESREKRHGRSGSIGPGNRRLSLSGRSEPEERKDDGAFHLQPSDECIPTGSKAFAARRSIGDGGDTREHDISPADKIVRHLAGTFNNTLMVLSDLMLKLEDEIKRNYARANEQRCLPHFRDLVRVLFEVKVLLTEAAHSVDSSVEVAHDAYEPDTVEEAMGLAKNSMSKFPQVYSHFNSCMLQARRAGMSLQLLVDVGGLESVDTLLSDAAQIISDLMALLR